MRLRKGFTTEQLKGFKEELELRMQNKNYADLSREMGRDMVKVIDRELFKRGKEE